MLDLVHLGSSLSVRTFARFGSALALLGAGRFGSGLSVPDDSYCGLRFYYYQISDGGAAPLTLVSGRSECAPEVSESFAAQSGKFSRSDFQSLQVPGRRSHAHG